MSKKNLSRMVAVHLHSHYSNYGMQDSVNTIEAIIKRVKDLGMTSFCLTDHGTCSGIVDAYKQAKKAGVKLIPGAELYYTNDLSVQERGLTHITFWAKDFEGLQNLYRLTTESHGNKGANPDNFYFKPRIDLALIKKYAKGLMVGTACLGGFMKRPDGEEVLRKLHAIFGDDLFIELHTYQCEEQYEHNHKLIELSKKYGIPLVAATDAHFSVPTDKDLHTYFKNTSKVQEGDEHLNETLYIMSDDEVRHYLSYLPSDIVETAIENTRIIDERSNVEIIFGEKNYPHYPCDDPYEEVRRRCIDAWKKDLSGSGKDLKVYDERIKTELAVLKLQEYCSYFLTTADYLNFAVDNSIPIGPGRGSAVASQVAKMVGITKLDPVELNLTFQRFAHDQRLAPPDIDCDISRKHRNKVIDYIRSKYGEVYQVRTFQVIGSSGAIRRAGDALGWDKALINDIAKSISKYEPQDGEEDISTYEQKIWVLDNIRTEETAELIDLAKRFVGIISGYGKHASAVLIVDEDIERFCSIERQVDSKTKQPCYIAACAYPLLEAQGLMKADVLGLKTLDVIDDCIKMVSQKFNGNKINIDKIPMDDEATSKMLCEGRTAGCFQIEGTGITQLVKQIRPKCFEDLIPLVALYRPGPLNALVEEVSDPELQRRINAYKSLQQWLSQGNSRETWFGWETLSESDLEKPNTMVQTYIKVKNNIELQQWIKDGNVRETWHHWKDNGGTLTESDVLEPMYLHEKLRPILQDTYSIILYQEQILEIAKALCGYSLGEADNLRRIIGKKKIDEMQPAIDQMIERGVANGISREVMQKVTTQIVEFASYCFNKSHSAAYGLLSYQTAYLKANYPLEYMCAVINSEENSQKDIIPYIKECTKLGIKVLPPDIRQKNREWTIIDGQLAMGLHYIKGIGNNLKLEHISIFEEVVASNPKDVTTALIKSGALDSFGKSRQTMLSEQSSVQERLKRIEQCEDKIKENSEALALATDDKLIKKFARQLKDWEAKLADAKAKSAELNNEYFDETIGEIEVLGFSDGIAPNVKVGKLTNLYSKIISNGTTMAWLTLKSDYGEFRCATFSDIWDHIKDLVHIGTSYKFVCKNNDKGSTLEEICIEGKTYKNEKRKWNKR